MKQHYYFFVLLEINYEDYPAFKNLYKIIEQIPEFQEIDEKFHEFLLPLEKNERSPSIFTYFKEVLTTIKFNEGGTGENRSDVTPLNFWIVLIYLAKNL